MKTLLARVKEDIQNDPVLRTYVKGVQIVAPDYLPDTALSLLPFVGIAPIASPETWFSTANKEVTHTVRLYVIHRLQIQEVSIIGSAQDRGLLDTIADVVSVVRSKFFPRDGVNYLSKPSEVISVDYSLGGAGDQIYSIIGVITIVCPRLFQVTI